MRFPILLAAIPIAVIGAIGWMTAPKPGDLGYGAGKAAQDIKSRYLKYEFRIPMRDGTKLYTAVYVPKNKPGKHPILLERTPYSAGPYGPDKYVQGHGGSSKFEEAGYIFAYQDVRGRFMSEGIWEEIRPQLQFKLKPTDIDESTDAYDTVDYLIKNVPDNNGRVGLWGISYPGFYASAAGIDTHPAIKAISPQAPVSDWFLGDDVHHNGAFFLQDNFDFYFWFGYDKDGPAEDHPNIEPMPERTDAYKFFMQMGSAINAEKYYKGRYPFWGDICRNPDMNDFWQSRSLPKKMKNVKCAVLTVGGWFDAEDCFGAFDTYRNVEKLNPGIKNSLIVGPWAHGQWSGGSANRLGSLTFGTQNLGVDFRDNVEFPFFDAYLRGDGKLNRPEAQMFDSGANQWKSFAEWPPKSLKSSAFFLNAGNALTSSKPGVQSAFDKYVSDPANPVPYTAGTIRGRPSHYMVEDQRFLNSRTDVLGYQSAALANDLTIAGPIEVDFWVTNSNRDADFVVKVIDVQPSSATGALKDAQIMIRGDVLRGRYRDSFQNPKPFAPNQLTRVRFTLNDVLHTFKKGHRVMVQIQSSWFPLVDRNPQKWVNTYTAKPEDYKPANIQIFRSATAPSAIRFGVL